MRDLLYHYTTEAGLTGIVESDTIRATDVRFLNDWTEFSVAFKESYVRILLDSFCARLPSDLPPDARLVLDRIVSRRAGEILDIIAGTQTANETFVCSFTSATPQESGDPGDRLSQWRAYGGTTQGFSLGFDQALLRERVEIDNQKAKATLRQCVYEEPEKITFFEEMGRAAASRFNEQRRQDAPVPDSFQTIRPNASEEYKKSNYYFLWALSRATAEFFTAAVRIKHEGFREEREWRVIFQAAKSVLATTVKFRDGQFGRTPYVEIPLGLAETKTSPLRRIVVGPGPRQEEAKRAVEALLKKRGIPIKSSGDQNGVEIGTSLIPFRSP
jgi:hypothetical protein